MSNPSNRNITTILNTKATAELNVAVQQELNANDEKSVAFLRNQETGEVTEADTDNSHADVLSVHDEDAVEDEASETW